MRYPFFIILLFIGLAGLSQSAKSIILEDTTYIYWDPDFELLRAASKGDTNKVKAFLKIGTDVNTTTSDGITPLMYAAQKGHLRLVEILIDKGADINLKPIYQIDALLIACILGHVEIADTLILNGADVNTRNLDGVTPLMYAAAYDNYLLADVLIFYKAKVNAVYNFGNSPLHFSSFYDNTELSSLLLMNGANPEIKDIQGFTPLLIAAQNGHLEQLQLLVEQGADIHKTTNKNLDALSLAIINDHYAMVEFLLSSGAKTGHSIAPKLNQADLAKKYASKNLLDLIIKAGAIPTARLSFESLFLMADLNTTSRDIAVGGHLGLYEAKKNMLFEMGFKTRPTERSVLYNDQPGIFYQYWEKRSVLHVGINKYFLLHRKRIHNEAGFFAGLMGAYTYGNFRGSVNKPDDQVLLVPKGGLFYHYKIFNLEISYEYMKFKKSKASPHRINISMGVRINLQKNHVKLKKEPIL